MDQNDRRAIDELFDKLDGVARSAPPRDAEAEAHIAERMARSPGAAYFLAQTVIVQEQALEQAQRQLAPALPPEPQGGFLSSIFGGGREASRGPARRANPWGGGQAGYPQPGRPGGSGFLAGAAQTALGIGGGILLANAVGGIFAGGDEDAGADDAGGDDGGGDFGGFDE